MKHEISYAQAIFDKEIEASLIVHHDELKEKAIIRGIEGAKKVVYTKTDFSIGMKEPVKISTQMFIEKIKNRLQPTATFFDAAEAERLAQSKIQDIDHESNDLREKRASLNAKLSQLLMDNLKRIFGKWLMPIALIVGLADGLLAYVALRNGSYSAGLALVAAGAIGAVISISHIPIVPWIKRAKNRLNQWLKIAFVSAVASVFFYWIGHLRSEAANQAVIIPEYGNEIAVSSTPHLNGNAITIISLVLFCGVLAFSLMVSKSKEERAKEQEYIKTKNEINTIDNQLTKLASERKRIEEEALVQKRNARKIIDYAQTSMKRCISIAYKSIATFKDTFMRHSPSAVPDYFSEPCEFDFDVSFQFTNTSKTNEV